MYCFLCENLERALDTARTAYIETSSLACSHISNKFAAYKNVEMERARTELAEHQLVCLAAANRPQSLQATPLWFAPRNGQRTRSAKTAA